MHQRNRMEMNAGMKKRFLTGLTLALILVLSLAGTALAADTFRFEEKSIRIFEGDTALPALGRSGAAAGEGELSFSVSKPSVLAVGEDGTITGLKKGESVLKATLKIGKKTWTASASVKVLRAVTKVTLNTTKLLTFRPTDVQISGLLEEEPEGNVILLTAGKKHIPWCFCYAGRRQRSEGDFCLIRRRGAPGPGQNCKGGSGRGVPA